MFFVASTSRVRRPYQVEETQKESDQWKWNPQQDFENQDEEKQGQKFKKAYQKLYRQREVIIASQMMQEVLIQLDASLSLEEALRIIQQHQVEYFPVVNEENKLLGILSKKDVLVALDRGKSDKKKLSHILPKETLCASPNTHLNHVLLACFKEKIEAVPVIDEKHRVLGILMRTDLLRTMLKISELTL